MHTFPNLDTVSKAYYSLFKEAQRQRGNPLSPARPKRKKRNPLSPARPKRGKRNPLSPGPPPKPEEESNLPWWMLGTGAALGGAGLAMRQGLSPGETRDITAFQDLGNKQYAPTAEGMLETIKDYDTVGHQASKADMFGATVGDFMKRVRSTPSVKALGFGWGKGDSEHYAEFAASPQRAYLRRLGELSKSPFEEGGLSSTALANLQSMFNDSSLTSRGDALTKHLGQEKLPEDYSFDKFLPALKEKLTEFKTLGGDDQDIIGGTFDEWLKTDSGDPELAKIKRTLDVNQGLDTEVREVTKGYSNIIAPVTAARKYLPWVGGAAALGGAGMLAYRWYQKKKEEEEAKKRQAVAKTRAQPLRPKIRKAAQLSEKGFRDGFMEILVFPSSQSLQSPLGVK